MHELAEPGVLQCEHELELTATTIHMTDHKRARREPVGQPAAKSASLEKVVIAMKVQ